MNNAMQLPLIVVQHDTMVALSDQIVFQIIYWMGRGALRPGQRLWSVRQLSKDLGINHNTILVAFAELQQGGFVESQGARGYFVAARPGWDRARLDAVHYATQMAPNILKQFAAHQVPMSVGVQALTLLALPTRFGGGAVRALEIVFTECNAASLTYFGDQLAEITSIPIQRRLLGDVARSPGVPDLVVTNIYHLGQLREYYDPGKFELVGLSVRVSDATRRALGRIPRTARIAVVAPSRTAMHNMASIATTALSSGHEVVPLNFEDLTELQQCLTHVDVIVVHDGTRGMLGALTSRQRVVDYATEYDPLSIDYLRERIQALQRATGVM